MYQYRFGAVVPVAASLQVAGGGVDGVRVALLQDGLLGHGALQGRNSTLLVQGGPSARRLGYVDISFLSQDNFSMRQNY